MMMRLYILCLILVASQCTIPSGAETTTTQSTATPDGATAGILETLAISTKLRTKPEVSTTLGIDQHYKDISEEFEAALTEKQQDKYMTYRSEASGNKTLHITADNSDKIYESTLCVKSSGDNKVRIQVIGVKYSNDGPSDTISLQLDGTHLGSAKTDEIYNGGFEWNVFKNTGTIGDATSLDNGNHTLSMAVKTDQWGAEFDSIKLRVHYQDAETAVFCGSKFN